MFAYQVTDRGRYGMVEFDQDAEALSIEEKPKICRSNWPVRGLYFYDRQAADIVAALKPSARGDLQITDIGPSWSVDN